MYKVKDVFMGVPVILGRNGIEEVIELKLNERELKLVLESANSVKDVMKVLDDMKLF
jgi:malate dehydrogenase